MNTIKVYSKKRPAPELFNLEHCEEQEVEIFGGHQKIKRPFNINVLFRDNEPENTYGKNLEVILKEFKKINPDISAAQIYDVKAATKLVELARLCRKYRLQFRTICLPFEALFIQVDGLELYKWLTKYNAVNCVEVSDFSDKEMMKKMSLYFTLHGGRMRLGFYETEPEKILAKIDEYGSICGDIIFRYKKKTEIKCELEYVRTMRNPMYEVEVFYYKNYVIKQYKEV